MFVERMNGWTHMQNIYEAFSANGWRSVSRMQGTSWDRDAGLGVIRDLVYLIILEPGIVSPM